MKHIKLNFICFVLLSLAGCFKTVHNDIPVAQIAMQSEQREQEAHKYYEQAQREESLGDYESAVKGYSIIYKSYLETRIAPYAFHACGHCFCALNRYEQAFEKFRFITKNYLTYKAYDTVVKEEFEVACHLMQNFQRSKKRSRFLSLFKDASPVIECFNHIITMAPHSKDTPRALYFMAQLEFKEGDKVKAIEALDRLIENYPSDEKIGDAYLLKAEIYLSFVNSAENDQGMTQKAIECYEDFLQIFGKNPDFATKIKEAKEGLLAAKNLYAQSRLALGDFFLYRRHYPEGAMVFYNEARLLSSGSFVETLANQRMDFIQADKPTPTNWADKLFGKVVYKPSRTAK